MSFSTRQKGNPYQPRENILRLGLFNDWSAQNVYNTLNTENDHIRLIRMASSGPSSSRHCFIEQFQLRAAPPYRALSYTWDYQSPWTNIWINEETFVVRETLCDLLLLFQSRHPGEHIWIDQICIDQRNVNEKNHQVSMMAAIYARASEVLIWLTPPGGEETKRVADAIRSTWPAEPMEELLDSVMSFVNHPYWKRTWIVQEVLLARALRIYFGAEIVDWNDVQQLAQNVQSDSIDFLASKALHPGALCPSDLLAHVLGTRCQDQRDVWFSIQGLLNKRCRTQVDYDQSTEEIFLDAALVLIMNAHDWSVLFLVYALGFYFSFTTPDPFRHRFTPSEDTELLIGLRRLLHTAGSSAEQELRELLRVVYQGREPVLGFEDFSDACRELVNAEDVMHGADFAQLISGELEIACQSQTCRARSRDRILSLRRRVEEARWVEVHGYATPPPTP